MDWKDKLNKFFQDTEDQKNKRIAQENDDKQIISKFTNEVVKSAFEEIKTELEKHGREVSYYLRSDSCVIEIKKNNYREAKYEIKFTGSRAYPVTYTDSEKGSFSGTGSFRSGAQTYGADSITKDEIIDYFFDYYTSYPKN